MKTESPVPNNRPVISDVYLMRQMLPADALMKMTGPYDLASHIGSSASIRCDQNLRHQGFVCLSRSDRSDVTRSRQCRIE